MPAAAESDGIGMALWNGLKTVGEAIETGTLVTVVAIGSLLIMTSDATPKIGKPLDRAFSSGPMSRTTQTFVWTESIKW